MKRIKRLFTVSLAFLGDLFKGPGNVYWDLARFVVGGFGALMGIATLWNIHLGKEIDLAALGGGLAAVLTAGGILILAKDKGSTMEPTPQ